MSSPVAERKSVILKSGRTYNLRTVPKVINLPVAKVETPVAEVKHKYRLKGTAPKLPVAKAEAHVVAPPMVAKKAEGGGGSRPVKAEEELVHLIKRCDKNPGVHSDAIPEVSSHVFHSKSRPTEAFQHMVDTIKHHSGTYQMFDIMCKPTGLPKGTKINMSGHTYDYDGRPKDTTGDIFVEISVYGPGGGYEEGVQNVEMLVAFADKTRDYGKIGSLGNYRYNLSIPIQDIINVLTKPVKAEGGGGSMPVKTEEKAEGEVMGFYDKYGSAIGSLAKSFQILFPERVSGYSIKHTGDSYVISFKHEGFAKSELLGTVIEQHPGLSIHIPKKKSGIITVKVEPSEVANYKRMTGKEEITSEDIEHLINVVFAEHYEYSSYSGSNHIKYDFKTGKLTVKGK